DRADHDEPGRGRRQRSRGQGNARAHAARAPCSRECRHARSGSGGAATVSRRRIHGIHVQQHDLLHSGTDRRDRRVAAPDRLSAAAGTAAAARPLTIDEGGVWTRGRRATAFGLILTITLVAFEALAVSVVLPIVAADLNGLPLYGWVMSAFFLGNLVGIVAA